MTNIPRLTETESIYDVVLSNIGSDGKISDWMLRLPDDELLTKDHISFAPGATDGFVTDEATDDEREAAAQTIANAILAACVDPTTESLRALLAATSQVRALGVIDQVMTSVIEAAPDRDSLKRVAYWLATTTNGRDAVKLGIALISVAGFTPESLEVVRTLGKHDEFTLYAISAFKHSAKTEDVAEKEIWNLAKHVDGWGRLHTVEALAKTDNPAVKDWLLREGFHNAIMDEYLAYTAATAGDLLAILRGSPDRGQLDSAGRILSALFDGGPAEDITDWADGAEATRRYIGHMSIRAETIPDLLAVSDVEDFVTDDDEDKWAALEPLGWTPALRTALAEQCEEIIKRNSWRELVQQGLASDDSQTFWQANRAAALLDIDTFDLHVARLNSDPLDSHEWYAAWEVADDEPRATTLVELAGKIFPFSDLTKPANDEDSDHINFRVSHTLGVILQHLRKYPGLGGELVVAGLNDPNTTLFTSTNMAFGVLHSWPREFWPPDAELSLLNLATNSKVELTKERAQKLLNGDTDSQSPQRW